MINNHLDGPKAIALNIIQEFDDLAPNQEKDMFARVVARLVMEHGFSDKDASFHAALAVSEHASRGISGRIIAKNSTDTCLFIEIEGQTHSVSLAQLIRFLEVSYA
jgi:hypothetical protein